MFYNRGKRNSDKDNTESGDVHASRKTSELALTRKTDNVVNHTPHMK